MMPFKSVELTINPLLKVYASSIGFGLFIVFFPFVVVSRRSAAVHNKIKVIKFYYGNLAICNETHGFPSSLHNEFSFFNANINDALY